MTSELQYLAAQERAADLRRSADRARLARATDPVTATARGGLIAHVVVTLRRGAGDAEEESAVPATPSAR